MARDVAVIGVGAAGFAVATPHLSWKELMYEAAVRAYADAGVDPRKDIDAFCTCAEDYWEGFGIFDEFTPDQLGAVQRSMFTVGGDGLQGLAQAFMLLKTGQFDRVVVEAHSKASDLLTYPDVMLHAFDPVWAKPLDGNPHWLAGMEMQAYVRGSKAREQACADVVVQNRANALANPLGVHGARLARDDVLGSQKVSDPLKLLDIAPLSDGCIVMVLAAREALKKEQRDRAVWLRGVGWSSDSPNLETRDWNRALYAELAARQAYELARVKNPRREADVVEVDDRFSYKELMHLEALGLAKPGEAAKLAAQGDLARDAALPTNVGGGSLGVGNLLEANGLLRALEVVTQLRGEAGPRQVKDASMGIAQSWRGPPTATGAVAVLGA